MLHKIQIYRLFNPVCRHDCLPEVKGYFSVNTFQKSVFRMKTVIRKHGVSKAEGILSKGNQKQIAETVLILCRDSIVRRLNNWNNFFLRTNPSPASLAEHYETYPLAAGIGIYGYWTVAAYAALILLIRKIRPIPMTSIQNCLAFMSASRETGTAKSISVMYTYFRKM